MNRFGGTVRRPYQPPESQADPNRAVSGNGSGSAVRRIADACKGASVSTSPDCGGSSKVIACSRGSALINRTLGHLKQKVVPGTAQPVALGAVTAWAVRSAEVHTVYRALSGNNPGIQRGASAAGKARRNEARGPSDVSTRWSASAATMRRA